MANNKMLHTKAEVLRENIKVEEGVIDAVIGSTNVIDRMGDIIDQAGWDLKNYENNPVILWGHNVREERPPIGKALKVWIEGAQKRTKKLMFKVKFDLEDTFAAEIFRKIKDGFINTVSVGFMPTEWEDIDKEKGPWGGRRYTKQELLELSFVPVPANPEAVVALRSMNDKRFEPEKLEDMYPQIKEEGDTIPPIVEKPAEEVKVEEKPVEEVKVDEKPVVEAPVVEKPAEDKPVDDKPVDEKPVEEKPVEEIKVEVAPVEEKPVEEKVEEASKSIIAFEDKGILAETESWDGPGEEAKAEVTDLKVMCAWFDVEKADTKSSYKLAHHKADGYKAVWRGVTAAMALLLGAKGGADIPEADRKEVYNHLKEHYTQFGKEAPDYKMVEEQVLAHLDNEILALTLDREEKHQTRLIKKAIDNEKDNSQKIIKALEVLNLALSIYKSDSLKGGEK